MLALAIQHDNQLLGSGRYQSFSPGFFKSLAVATGSCGGSHILRIHAPSWAGYSTPARLYIARHARNTSR